MRKIRKYDVFGKDAQEMNKPLYRLDRDKIHRELLYHVPFCVVWIFEP